MVRVHEALGGRARGRVRVECPVASVVEANLLEEPEAPARDPAPDPSVVDVALGPFEVRTLRFALASVSST